MLKEINNIRNTIRSNDKEKELANAVYILALQQKSELNKIATALKETIDNSNLSKDLSFNLKALLSSLRDTTTSSKDLLTVLDIVLGTDAKKVAKLESIINS
ncbi:hypothetical protein [Lactobacillus mulieris]|uniref:hypothetical protein n=1 Tax=Lactobacillus mulieris TaxID=2508708 RepID=UPI0022AC83FF|nr:hypothetical protein [Lactobacillus mulieris]MCZ3742191.1 hypothetical protein [Lactobacillus mulieris]MCZ3749029.1 hypothetical protein [Lactobacillus mulieris]MCZ3750658.1 hypothetical protein [Lactobacillus mulieris]MDT9629387.1 hypothetical protein [Lactobacillus mulieris]